MVPPGRLVAAVALAGLVSAGCAEAPAENPPADENTADPVANPVAEDRAAFARCIRENGVADFPDPDADGVIQYHGEDPDFESAQQTCRHLSPPVAGQEGNGG